MKKALIGTAVVALLAGTAGTSLAGTTDGQGAQKRGLFPTKGSMTSQCNSAPSDAAGSLSGFVILNAPGKVGSVQKVVGEVSLKTGMPGTTYMVQLAMGGNCVLVGTLTTNAQGNGNAHIDAPGTGGSYYVVLTDPANEVYASSPVNLI